MQPCLSQGQGDRKILTEQKLNQTVFRQEIVCECSYRRSECVSFEKTSVFLFFHRLRRHFDSMCAMFCWLDPKKCLHKQDKVSFPFFFLQFEPRFGRLHAMQDDESHSKRVTVGSLRSEARVSISYSFTLFLLQHF